MSGLLSPVTTAWVMWMWRISSLLGTSYMMSSISFSSRLRNARAPVPFLMRLRGQFVQRVRRELQFHAFHRHQLGVLLGQRVLGVGQNRNQLVLGQFRQHGHHRQAADELGDEAEAEQIFRLDVLQQFLPVDGAGLDARPPRRGSP